MNRQTQHHSDFAFNSSYRGEQQMSTCDCIFCAGIVAVCSGSSSRGVCTCGFCCEPIQQSFGMTKQDMLDEERRIAEFVENELEREIWIAEAMWLSLVDFRGFLANRLGAVTVLGQKG
ncbi:hypothetical protein [Pseudomonas sp. Irchel 3E13]|uniref:hypothetical protein n=1 Tax=Pseudomonas sp. Irchel 3E13 TaxID=2008975 RepID=UPI00117B5414|nr:hypothetical protein [Pseudomonas sp. Irchel 3E13]